MLYRGKCVLSPNEGRADYRRLLLLFHWETPFSKSIIFAGPARQREMKIKEIR